MPRSFLLTNRRYRLAHYTHYHERKETAEDDVESSLQTAPLETMYDSRVLLRQAIQRKLQAAEAFITQEYHSLNADTRDSTPYKLIPEPLLLPRPRSFSIESEDRSSPDTHTEYSHTCSICYKSYSTSSNLARHRQTHRSLTDKKARKCPHCEKVYVSMPAFSMHVRTHNQGCECIVCGKKFSRPWLLQGHLRTHTGEKPYKCDKCGKGFADKSNLRAHVQTHSNEKPFLCGRCGKAFALKSYLYKHEEASCLRGQKRDTRGNTSESEPEKESDGDLTHY